MPLAEQEKNIRYQAELYCQYNGHRQNLSPVIVSADSDFTARGILIRDYIKGKTCDHVDENGQKDCNSPIVIRGELTIIG